jgi:putative DNA primase/helicase
MAQEISINVDGIIDIATGRTRRELKWKNKEITWSDLVKKLSTTHRTAETLAEYTAAKKTRQDEIKDIGGFVGGYLSQGRRKAGNVTHRQLITLDIDDGHKLLWDDFTMLFDCAAAMYSTHKHSPDHPRLRLVMPLDRKVTSEEYMAISRKIAGTLGINFFDHTTFQPERLMYWPSTSKDGEYVFHYQDAIWLSADEILNSYHDWRDTSAWPVSDREKEIVKKGIAKQGDPLEKPGIVGAFCRTYTITEVIENFLSDVYDACDVDNRYTYREGSTGAGLVVYDDKFTYSHHGTDPTSGKLCNAFDLVRLHKFGLKDEDAKEGTAINKMPSYLAMEDFASKDDKVVQTRSVETLQNAKYEFAEEVIEAALSEEKNVDDTDWIKDIKFELDKKGNYLSTIDNIYLYLKHSPDLKEKFYLNEFEARIMITADLPWRKVTKTSRDFTDDDLNCLEHYLEKHKIPFTNTQKALAKIRTDFKIHPVREYLSKLTWDQEPRVDELFIDYLGAEDSRYTRAVARKTFVAAIARVFEPGCKFDNVLTFVGKEGIGKSTLVAKLAKEWFSDCLGDIHGKEGMESLRGVWIMEIAEMASLRRADQEAIKRFISSREDVYRPAYGRQLVRFPRQCIFFATTNKEDFLTGSHGNRRFWPVATHVQQPTKDVFSDLTNKEINQVWAEALHYYKQGEQVNLSEDLRNEAEEIRDAHSELDDRAGLIEKYLNTLLPENWEEMSLYQRRSYLTSEDELQAKGTVQRTHVCVAEIWCEALSCLQRDMTNNNTKYIHDVMRKLKGWEPFKSSRRFSFYGTQRGFQKVKKFVNTA